MTSAQPNILYIHSHDTGRFLGAYGHAVSTPNLDRLASEGVMFRNAHCAAPTCCPSRAALASGRWAHCTGMLGLTGMGWSMSDYNQHWVTPLKQAGYQTTLIGLQHVTRTVGDIGYDQVVKPDRHFYAEEITTAAEEFLKGAVEHPFFLDVGYFLTHRPFYPSEMPPDEFRDRYRDHAIDCAPVEGLPNTMDIRCDTAALVSEVEEYDRHVGRVLQALEESGLADETIVLATTDHGLAFPFHKCTLSDRGSGVFLLMRGPRGSAFRGGVASDALVSHIDVMPTLFELAGLPCPGSVQGVSLVPLVTGATTRVRDELFVEITAHAVPEPQRAVRTERYKYIRRYDGRTRAVLPNIDGSYSKQFVVAAGLCDLELPQEALYDLYLDPSESHNRISDPTLVEVLLDMKSRLDRWMLETADPLLELESLRWPAEQNLSIDDYAPKGEARKQGSYLNRPPLPGEILLDASSPTTKSRA